MKDFFISYNQADRGWAEWAAYQLEQAGYSTILQAWDFRPGSDFVAEMQRAMSESKQTLAILSPDYLQSGFTAAEWADAFSRDPKGLSQRLIPVRVRECELPPLLNTRIYVNLVGLTEEEARERLISGIKSERQKPVLPPAFPGGNVGAQEESVGPEFPGALPSVWNVPHLRNRYFVGRDTQIEALRKTLQSGQPAALTQVLQGLGGIGKTQTAIEYLYRFAENYGIVWWLPSEDPLRLANEYARLTDALSVPLSTDADQQTKVHYARRWLEQHTGWILVFDNAEDQASLLPFLPRSETGHVLITSRNPNWDGFAQVVPIPVLTRSESLQFLRNRLDSPDDSLLQNLAELVGDLPLALEQAAAYIKATGGSVERYISLFHAYRARLLASGTPSTLYPSTVATTWLISFTRIEEEAPLGASLLHFLAHVAPNDVPANLVEIALSRLSTMSGSDLNPVDFDEAVAAARRYALAEVGPSGTYSIHRLVQAVIADREDPEERARWTAIAVGAIGELFPIDADFVSNWSVCEELLPHGLAATALAEQQDLCLPSTLALSGRMALFLASRGEYRDAERLLTTAILHFDLLVEPDFHLLADLQTDLAIVEMELGDLRGALNWAKTAVETIEGHFGGQGDDLLHPLVNLSAVLSARGDFPSAMECLDRARILGETTGSDPLEHAVRLNNMGRILEKRGDLRGALMYYEQCIAAREHALGKDDPSLAIPLSNMGLALKKLGDYKEARGYFERALELARLYGDSHPILANALNNMGFLMEAVGELSPAQAFYEQALPLMERIHGAESAYVAVCLSNLGSIASKNGDLVKARSFAERTLAIDTKVFGPNHVEVAGDHNNLGGICYREGDYTAAREHFEKAIGIYSSVNEHHSELPLVFANLGAALRGLGALNEAIETYIHGLSVAQVSLGSNAPERAELETGLGQTYQAMGRHGKSLKHFQAGLTILTKCYGPTHMLVAYNHMLLGDAHRALKTFRKAQEHYQVALSIARRIGNRDIEAACTLRLLALESHPLN